MKNLIAYTIICLMILITIPLLLAKESKDTESDPKALEIMEKHEERFNIDDEARLMSMSIKPKTGVERERKLFMVIKTTKDGEKKTLFRITEPPGVAGTGLLSYELEKGYHQWLFTPEENKIKRLGRDAMTDTAVGTDFTYEDLQFMNLGIHNYKLKESQKIKDHNCWVIEITPKNKKFAKESGYSKRLYYIRKDITYFIRVEYFDKDGKFIKTQDLDNIIEVIPGIWRNMKFTMVTHETGHKTIVKIDKIAINIGLPEEYFTRRFLMRETDKTPKLP